MAVTIEDVFIPNNVWVDLYDESGVAVGTAVTVINTGSSPAQIAISAAAPTNNAIGIPLYAGAVGSTALVSASEVGLWAICLDGTTSINVQG